MKLFYKYWLVVILTFGFNINFFESKAQLSEKGIPESFLLFQKKALRIPTMILDSVHLGKMLEEDRKLSIKNRYGVVQSVEINIREEGIRTEIQDKGTIWRYKIESKNALSLGIFFKEFRIPRAAKVFIYNSSRTQILGAFTHLNNPANNLFPVADFPGQELIIEYFEPISPEFPGELILGSVSQAYTKLQKLNEGRIGINCGAGKDWQIIKHSVCVLTFHNFESSYFCTGALINNVKEDETPYFLTANHCLKTEAEANTVITYFNYENSTCESDDAFFSQSLAGATFKAGSNYTDFTLLLLNEYPPDEYNPFYAGWDVTGINPRSSACIHHPDGDPKSIATAHNTAFSYSEKIVWYSDDLIPISTTLPDTHWFTVFNEGLPEAGSSGAPLFDQNKRIVGQLHGGVNSVLLFGKLALSWDYNKANTEQLAYWLDPFKTRKTLDGVWKSPPRSNFRSELQEVCVNAPVFFTDLSTHKPSEWLWQIEPHSYSFTNGTDSTSQNPQVVFLKDGTYSVKLKTSNKYGSNEFVQKKYILARSVLDVRFQKSSKDTVVCGCDLKKFTLIASGAVNYSFKTDKAELIETETQNNKVFLTLKQPLTSNQSFYTWIRVTGTNSHCIASDSILMHVIIQPNDDIKNAARLFLGRNTGYSNKCATVEVNEPNPPSLGCLVKKAWCPDLRPTSGLLDNSIWFTFSSPSTGLITIDTKGFDNQIAVYEASTYSSILTGDKKQFTIIAANDNRSSNDNTASIEDLVLVPGKQYWLQVDGHNKAYGDITIDLSSNSLEADVFPNPSNGMFKLNLFHPEAGIAEVSVLNLNGKKIFSNHYPVNLDSYQFNLELRGYPRGIYILQVKLNESKLSKKLVFLSGHSNY